MRSRLDRLEEKLTLLRSIATNSPARLDRVDRAVDAALKSLSGEPEALTLADVARSVLLTRARRSTVLGAEMFRDPAWDILLDLYTTRDEDRASCVSDLCVAAGVPQTTGLRYIAAMEQLGFVRRKSDPRDARRILIELDDKAEEGVGELMRILPVRL